MTISRIECPQCCNNIYEFARNVINEVYTRICAIVRTCLDYLQKLWTIIVSCCDDSAQIQERAMEQIYTVRKELADNMSEFTDGNMTPEKMQRINAICTGLPVLDDIPNTAPGVYDKKALIAKIRELTLAECAAIKNTDYDLRTIPENSIIAISNRNEIVTRGPIFFRVMHKRFFLEHSVHYYCTQVDLKVPLTDQNLSFNSLISQSPIITIQYQYGLEHSYGYRVDILKGNCLEHENNVAQLAHNQIFPRGVDKIIAEYAHPTDPNYFTLSNVQNNLKIDEIVLFTLI